MPYFSHRYLCRWVYHCPNLSKEKYNVLQITQMKLEKSYFTVKSSQKFPDLLNYYGTIAHFKNNINISRMLRFQD
jgi:hypothetical protein